MQFSVSDDDRLTCVITLEGRRGSEGRLNNPVSETRREAKAADKVYNLQMITGLKCL